MTQFLDVLLRGVLLACVSVACGGVAWTVAVLRASPRAKPDGATRLALRATALAAALGAAAQIAVGLLVLGDLTRHSGSAPLAAFLDTAFAHAVIARAGLGVVLAVLAARLASRPGGPATWIALGAAAFAFVATGAAVSHAASRVADRSWLLPLDAAHQLAVAVWVGGLVHLTCYAARADREPDPRDAVVARRFSMLALLSVGLLVASGVVLTMKYVGDPAAMVGTAYGVMILSKVVLLLAILGVAALNYRVVRRIDDMGGLERAPQAPRRSEHPGKAVALLDHARAGGTTGGRRLARLVEVEVGLGLTVLFAAASLTSLPPGVDVAAADRATPAEVAARFVPAPPRLTSPPVDELLRTADPLMAPVVRRLDVERAWSEYNHHWAGAFVLAMGLLAVSERWGFRAGRHWPLLLLALAAFLFVRNDPRAWPLGPAGFWESMTLPDVLQHRAFVVLIVAFGVFEWAVRTGRLRPRPWGLVFPLVGAVGGGLLLTHSHAMFNLKEEFLTEITHAPLGILGAFMGWARWTELRLPEAGPAPGWIWRLCFVAVGLLLLFYREA
jgi:putative copper resistance protein D